MTTRFFDWCFAATVASFGVAYAIGIYWMFIDYRIRPIDEVLNPVFMSDSPGGEAHTDFQAGGLLYLNWDINILRRCSVDFQRSIVNINTTVVTILESHSGVQPGKVGPVVFATRLQLPANLEKGQYEYRLKGVFRCNPVEALVKDYQAVPFRIIE